MEPQTQNQQTGTTAAPQQFVNLLSAKGIGIVFVVIAIIWTMTTYNSLVTKAQAVDTQWAQVETQYQRRLDLIPNLVGAVEGAMKQEKEVFTAIADARTRYAGAGTTAEKVAAANQVESAFARLLVVMENYPQLKSVDTVNALMAENAGTENRIAVERGRYNETVGVYQIATKRFPGGLIASIFGFGPRDMFEAAAGAENAPKVEF